VRGRSSHQSCHFTHAHSVAKVPKDDIDLLQSLRNFLRAFCAADGRTEDAAAAFLQELQAEALRARGGPGVGGTEAEEMARRVDEMLSRCGRQARGRCAVGPVCVRLSRCGRQARGHCAVGPVCVRLSRCGRQARGRCAVGPVCVRLSRCGRQARGRCAGYVRRHVQAWLVCTGADSSLVCSRPSLRSAANQARFRWTRCCAGGVRDLDPVRVRSRQ
jgi:hypothetical protein